MKCVIQRAEMSPYRLPLTAPLALKGHRLAAREGWLLKLTTRTGEVGYGDVAPLPGFSAETPDQAAAELEALCATLPGQAVSEAQVRAGYPAHACAAVRFGVELALVELFAAQVGYTPAVWLSPTARTRPALNGLLSGDPAAFEAQARQYRDAGFQAVKMKVGRQSVAEDVARVRAVHAVLGPAVALRLDANQAWTYKEALAFAAGITPVEVEYIEEPLRDPSRLPDLARAWPLPIALDESALGRSLEALTAHRYATAVVYKPTLAGGLMHGLHLAERAQALGLRVVVSAAYESGVGILGLAALAAAVNVDDIPAGLDTYRWLQTDVWHPRLDLARGYLDLPAAYGTPRRWHPDLHFAHD